ncbi:2,3-dihydro-2,3-dihydroxybenzoate dehydrogenase [Sphaerisporangium dianthi]|uniref:2,3-dihydro-2,3-dihydroxybenzoate dehydrogenase n=1 Tax=Sphaerisporangium dianthi TaxID=1436120 RepID=A0ABV9CWB3_9ACTN
MNADAGPRGAAVVTGAAGGIGAAVVHALAGQGVDVGAVDVDKAGLDALAGAARSASGSVLPVPADVRDAGRSQEAIERVERELGPVGMLVNVAGVLRPGPVAGLTDDDWAETFAVNVWGVFHMSRAAVRAMIPRRSGAIVTVTSNAAGVPRVGMAAYAASKAAATMFTKCLGLEVAHHGIRCNVVAPGSTDTAMQRVLWESPDGPPDGDPAVMGDLAKYRVGIPLGRVAAPSDIADAVLFLLSDRARHITMHDLYVDGGATLRA